MKTLNVQVRIFFNKNESLKIHSITLFYSLMSKISELLFVQ